MYITEKIFGKLTYAVFRLNYGAAVCNQENEEGRVFIQIKIEIFRFEYYFSLLYDC
jgi:hypothetical protein